MMPHAKLAAAQRRRFHDDEVDPDGQVRHGSPVRQPSGLEERRGGPPEPHPLRLAERLLGQAEVAPGPPADLDHDEPGGWTRIDGNDVELAPPGPDVSAEHEPAL